MEPSLSSAQSQFEQKVEQWMKLDISLDTNSITLSRDEQKALVISLLLRLNVLQVLKVNMVQLHEYISTVEALYQQVPYHCFEHAVDVTLVSFIIFQDFLKLQQSFGNCENNKDNDMNNRVNVQLSEIDGIMLMLAALCHDVGHPGLNNLFHVNAETDLAMLTGEESVLEVLSAAYCVKLSRQAGILQSCKERWQQEQLMYEMILATDMKYHYNIKSILNDYEVSRDNPSSLYACKKLLLCSILHCADISNPCRQFPLAKQWSDMVQTEFYAQGDLEQYLGLPISPNMNRPNAVQDTPQLQQQYQILQQQQQIFTSSSTLDQTDQYVRKQYISKQVEMALSFGDFIVKPYLEKMEKFGTQIFGCSTIDSIKYMIEGVSSNREQWLKLKKDSEQSGSYHSTKPSTLTSSYNQSETSVADVPSPHGLPQSPSRKQLAQVNRRLSVASGVIQLTDNENEEDHNVRSRLGRNFTHSTLKLSLGSKLSGLSESLTSSMSSRVSSLAAIKSRRSSANYQPDIQTPNAGISSSSEQSQFTKRKPSITTPHKLFAVASGIQLVSDENKTDDALDSGSAVAADNSDPLFEFSRTGLLFKKRLSEQNDNHHHFTVVQEQMIRKLNGLSRLSRPKGYLYKVKTAQNIEFQSGRMYQNYIKALGSNESLRSSDDQKVMQQQKQQYQTAQSSAGQIVQRQKGKKLLKTVHTLSLQSNNSSSSKSAHITQSPTVEYNKWIPWRGGDGRASSDDDLVLTSTAGILSVSNSELNKAAEGQDTGFSNSISPTRRGRNFTLGTLMRQQDQEQSSLSLQGPLQKNL
ncbi:hypothetical protein MP228_003234 [Amoeboaphelidium protococcarum]|nr:hypothetical protein MP228_003234 [Amoeboaphelidium protococcarum]